MANNVQVRTGPSSYLNFNEADAKEWRKHNKEWSEGDPQSVSVQEEQANQDASGEKQRTDDAIAERAVTVPKSKKSDG